MKVWKKLRLKSKATPYEIAKELNIDEDKYIEIEEFREELISRLDDYITYRKGNASSEHLHKKAKQIREKHIIKEFTHTDFESYFGGDK